MKFPSPRYLLLCVPVMIWLGIHFAAKLDSTKASDVTLLGQQNINEPNDASCENKSLPIIIWYYPLHHENPEILEVALSSGFFTHVMLSGIHKDDIPDYSERPVYKLQETMKICKAGGVKIIWKRWLWPGYKFNNFTKSCIFDPNYYAEQIRQIKRETKMIGADYSALDCEAYGYSPLKPMRKRNLSGPEFEKMTNAVDKAIGREGQVDFILPAALPYPRHARSFMHFYRPLEKLGKLTIAEHTYYNNPSRLHCKNNVFDIFGAYCKKNSFNPESPSTPYFSPREILERRDLWGHKKGLFIYSGDAKDSLEVAFELSKIDKFNK